MRLQHLSESFNEALLTKVWEGTHAAALHQLLKMEDDENLQMLARVIESAIAKHAKSDPLQLFSLLPAIIKAYDKVGPAIRDIIQKLFHALTTQAIKDPVVLKRLVDKTDIKSLEKVLDRNKHWVNVKLAIDKLSRTKDQEQYDDETDQFVFIARDAFKEVPEGSGDFRKTLEIENMVKVDRFDANAHQMVGMMKFRARAQGQGSEVYMVNLPKGEIKGGQPPDYMLDLIKQHMKKVTN